VTVILNGAFSDALGNASIVNEGPNYNSLMILGRRTAANRRAISLWDDVSIRAGHLTVAGGVTVGEVLTPSAGTGARGIVFPRDPGGGGGDVAYIQYYVKSGESTRLDIANMNDVDDDIWIHAGGSVIINNAVTPSDKRLKENITPLAYGLAQIKKLLPVSYDWKNTINRKKSIGLLAQDVESVINEAVFENKKDKDSTEFSLSYNSLIPVLINAIKELDQKLEDTQLKLAKFQLG
jgi:Chaperone of endosialidase